MPSVNFDDFHTSITSNEPSLNEFPAPGRGGGFPAKKGIIQAEDTPGEANDKGQGRAVGAAASASRIGRSGSLLQRHNSVAKQRNQVSAGMEPMGPPSAPLPVRTRRQSEFPALSTNAVVGRPPRKSIGPGVIGADFVDRVTQRRRPSLTSRNTANNPNITDSSGSSFIRLSIDGNGDAANDKSSLLPTARNMKTKSLQPPSRQMQGHLCTPAMTPDHASSSSVNAARSPGRSAGRRTNTPSSAKRLSVMPVHATGLGARTISPTDARRLKRLSALQGAPPMPQTPPTPQPDPLSGFRSATQSPSLLPRKSVTPSSSRTTPEHNRKSYSSGLSISSNTSYNSLRTSSGSMQQSRFSQNISTSRLPTPKPRNDSNCAGGEEEVPPVPAIPKAYESPKAELDQPFFSVRKPSLPFDASSVTSTSTTGCVPRPGATLEAPIVDREARGRRGLTTGSGSDVEIRASAAPTMSKRKLQPLRLPPLNLLPLSTPTAAKIAALQEPSLDIEAGAITPPPKRGTAKTPSTPMTASKASFFSKSHQDEEAMPAAAHTRSSSSNHALRPETSSFRATSDSSSSGATATNSRAGRQAISPFISSSLPKASADFSYMRSKDSEVYNTINVPAETRSIRLTGPRAQTVSKVREEALTRPSSPTEGETPSLGTSIRRKLSVTRKKGITQPSQFPAEHDSRQPPQAPKHDAMPPPRLPASATWSGQLNLSPSPTTRPSLLQSKGKASSNGNINGHGRTRSDTWDSDRSPKKESVPFSELPDYSIQASPAKSSILSPMHRILSSKSPLNTMKARGLDTHLDRDDLSAEEEMKKLASKRKDFETAAREVDELRRRATPKERVSPTQALRMVNLNIFERGEIVDYKEIYFCGTQNAKKHVGDLNPQAVNFGYDDDRGDYNIVDGDHLAYRYEIVDILGKGSFGQVVRCVDHKTGGVVAVKIIRNKKRFHQQALVEVNILQKLREWVCNMIMQIQSNDC